MTDRGTLNVNESHPAASAALVYIRSIDLIELYELLESFSSCAIENNRLGEICGTTLDRILKGKPVSDRYLLGLAWTIKSIRDKEHNE